VDKKEIIGYWIGTADSDYSTMTNLYESEDYHWSLFMGHLVIEKLIKAVYIINIGNNPPKTHDLLRLADKALIETSKEQKDLLDLLTTFNISARYPDYKHSFYKKCTHKFIIENIKKIKELRTWLLSIVEDK